MKSPHAPIHQVTDYFTRYEFAERGTIHIHWFAYLKNAPEYGETDNDTVAKYYDNIISCSFDVAEEHKDTYSIRFLDSQVMSYRKHTQV